MPTFALFKTSVERRAIYRQPWSFWHALYYILPAITGRQSSLTLYGLQPSTSPVTYHRYSILISHPIREPYSINLNWKSQINLFDFWSISLDIHHSFMLVSDSSRGVCDSSDHWHVSTYWLAQFSLA